MKTSVFICAFTFAILAACGRKDNAAPNVATAAVGAPANDYQGGVACGDAVVDAYITVYRVCGDIHNQRGMHNPRTEHERYRGPGRSDVNPRACRDLGNEFLQNYPQVDCNASVVDREGQSYSFTIQDAYVRRIMRN